MKKIIALTLMMVLALGASVMAADVKVGGELRYRLRSVEDADTFWYMTSNLTVDVKFDEKTSAFVQFDNEGLGDVKKRNDESLAYAYMTTTPGVVPGSFSFGKVTFGSGVPAIFSKVGGNVLDGTEAIAYSGTFSNVTVDAIFVPSDSATNADGNAVAPTTDSQFGLEVSGKVADLDLGFNYYPADAVDQWSVDASYPVIPEKLTVYGEFGSTKKDDTNVQVIGAKTPVGPVTLQGEADLDSEKVAVSATTVFAGIKYNATYTAYYGDDDSVKNVLTAYARVNF